MLYVFDPVALHNIIVKDQYIYEEAAWFIKYVNYVSDVIGHLPTHTMFWIDSTSCVSAPDF